MNDTVYVFTINRNDITVHKFASACRLNCSVAQDCPLCDEFLYNTAARNCPRELEKLIELDRLCMDLDICQCVLTGVTT